MNALRTAVVSCIAIASVGCTIYADDRHRHDHWDDSAPTYVETPSEEPAAPATDSTASITPMLVDVDTNQTMDAEGGDGVGVFVEYFEGGHWRIWWSCDTNQTGQSCDFTVSASAATGTISNLDDHDLDDDAVLKEPSTSQIDVRSNTTTEVRGIRFDTDPGATITVEATLGSLRDGSFLFFVQDGKIKGGFDGRLTNPLQLRGTTP